MKIIKKGSTVVEAVVSLQELLNRAGFGLKVDGNFGPKTDKAVKEYQKQSKLVVDGIVGPKTWTTLFSQFPEHNKEKASKFLSEKDLIDVAADLGIELASIKAVNEVESAGRGFIGGEPKILFEGHIFWQRLLANGLSPMDLKIGNEDVLYPRWTTKFYLGGIAEHDRLNKAKKIHDDSAYESASWGLFQIMGFHWKSLKYKSVKEFVRLMAKNEREHLIAFGRFIKANKLVKHLRNREWSEFAKKYNGPGFKKHKYDERIERAYEKYKTQV